MNYFSNFRLAELIAVRTSVALWLLLGMISIAQAHDPLDRLKKGDYDGFTDDALRTGWVIAGVSGVGATGVALALRRKLLAAETSRPPNWPKDLKGPNSFCELGHAIRQETMFPGTSTADNARYVFERMREAARIYGLGIAQPAIKRGYGGVPYLSPTGVKHQLELLYTRPEEWRPYVLGASTAVIAAAVAGPAAAAVIKSAPKLASAVGSGSAGAIGFMGGHAGSQYLGSWLPPLIVGGAGAIIGGAFGGPVLGYAGKVAGFTIGTKVAMGLGAFAGFVGGYLGYGQVQQLEDPDEEDAGGLKGAGLGNCGEWSRSFAKLMSCAGIQGEVIYGDYSDSSTASRGHGGTDTAMFVREKVGNKEVRRVFDIFQQMFQNQGNAPGSPSEWSDMPMTADDLKPGERITPGEPSPVWLDNVGKPLIKDGKGNLIYRRP